MEKEYKCILNAGTARRLLHDGHIVVDIKPMKEDKEKTVFIFEATEKFKNDLASINK